MVGYAVAAAVFLGVVVTGVSHSIPAWVGGGAALGIPLAFAIMFTRAQHAPCAAAREAGAQPASVVLPLLVGLILAIAQAFALWFLTLQLSGPV